MSTALVTGATSGIGLSFAHQLAERGHDVVLVARDRVRLENVSDELRAKYGVGTEILVADLSDRAETGKVAERLADHAIEHARTRGLKVVPTCSFVRAHMARHPEHADLMA